VTLNRCDSTSQRLAIHIIHQDPKPRSRRDLGNAMTHCAGADDGNTLNRFRTASWVAHLAENRAQSASTHQKPHSSTTPISVVILYAQPKRLYSGVSIWKFSSALFAVLCVLCVKKGL